MTMALPLAHFGHVLVDLPIFFGPVFGLTMWILYVARRDRRREASKREKGGGSRRARAAAR